LLASTLLALFAWMPIDAAEAPVDPDGAEIQTRTVYIVELVVFAHQAGLAGSDERWPPELDTPPWENAVIPWHLPLPEDDASQVSVDTASQTDPETDPLDDELLGMAEARPPRPEVWVASPEQMVLGEALGRLQRDPRFDVLLHQAWQQEGLPQTESFSVMVSDVPLGLYFPTEEELAAQALMDAEAEIDDGEDGAIDATAAVVPTDPSAQKPNATDGTAAFEESGDGVLLVAQADERSSPYDDPTARLVGQVRVYLERYLHMQLDLVFDTGLVPDASQLLLPAVADDGPVVAAASDPKDQPVVIQREQQDRARSRDARRNDGRGDERVEGRAGGFEVEKASEPQTLRVRLVESRRMRSTEIHYFDHPVIGVIATITPWEVPLEDSEYGDQGSVEGAAAD
jgi:hypothetical protein